MPEAAGVEEPRTSPLTSFAELPPSGPARRVHDFDIIQLTTRDADQDFSRCRAGLQRRCRLSGSRGHGATLPSHTPSSPAPACGSPVCSRPPRPAGTAGLTMQCGHTPRPPLLVRAGRPRLAWPSSLLPTRAGGSPACGHGGLGDAAPAARPSAFQGPRACRALLPGWHGSPQLLSLVREEQEGLFLPGGGGWELASLYLQGPQRSAGGSASLIRARQRCVPWGRAQSWAFLGQG